MLPSGPLSMPTSMPPLMSPFTPPSMPPYIPALARAEVVRFCRVDYASLRGGKGLANGWAVPSMPWPGGIEQAHKGSKWVPPLMPPSMPPYMPPSMPPSAPPSMPPNLPPSISVSGWVNGGEQPWTPMQGWNVGLRPTLPPLLANSANLLTKGLALASHVKHRACMLNLP